MKTKQVSIWVLSILLLVSCTKQDIRTNQEIQQEQIPFTSTQTNSVSETMSAYIFLEPYSKYLMIRNYLRDSVVQSPGLKFLGFFMGPGAAIQNNVTHYFDMPHWTDGRLVFYTAEIPQTNGGIDDYGNPKKSFNFTTIKIPKNTVNGMGWVNIMIPINAMSNDTKRQKSVYVYQKIGNTLVTNGTFQGFNYTTNSTLYSFIVNYQGSKIPKGLYRLYTTYPSTGLRLNFDSTKDVYIRGNGN